MSGIADTLWEQFGTEVVEHLDLVERQLSEQEGSPPSERVATLFRSFHSIKGLAAAMGVQAMEAVAHSAESLLARVRDGALPLDDRVAGLLIDCLDTLRDMADEALATRADIAERPELVSRVSAAASSGARGKQAAEAEAGAGPAGIDGSDARVLALAERLAGTMGDLVAAMLPAAPPEALAQLDSDLLTLDGLVGGLGFQGLRRQVRRLSRAVHRGRPESRLLHDVARALVVVEGITGREAGSRALLGYVAQRGAGDLVRQCARAAEALRSPEDDHVELAAVAVEAASEQAELLALERSDALLLLALDLLRRSGLDEPARRTLVGVLDRIAEAASANPPEDVRESEAARLEERLRAVVAGKGVEATIERVLALGVGRPLLEQISDEARRHLSAALDDPNLLLVEIDADLDSDAALARAFAAWVADNADPVTSRVIATDSGLRTHLLIATPARPAAVLADLSGLDRSGELLRVTICDGQGGSSRRDAATSQSHGDDTLRVPAAIIDDLLDQLGELMPVAVGLDALVHEPALTTHQREALLHAGLAARDLEAALERLDDRHARLRRLGDDLARVMRRLRDATLELRVVPVDTLFARFPRLVRDTARQLGKEVRLVAEGNDARIDKAMVERLADPLMHMIRNAIDHGIEPPEERVAAGKPARATLVLRAGQRGEHVTIEIADDGRGLDAERIRRRAVEVGLLTADAAASADADAIHRLIFEPGFSTAEQVTQTSGRGVGMDVVAAVATELGGSIDLRSVVGEGTRFVLELPLSVAIQSTLVIEQSGQVFALPDRHVAAVAQSNGAMVALPGLPPAPVVGLAELLDLEVEPIAASGQVVVIQAGERRLGLRVERVLRRTDVLVKDSHPAITAVPGLGGASRLGDGRIVLILDPDGLIGLAQGIVARHETVREA